MYASEALKAYSEIAIIAATNAITAKGFADSKFWSNKAYVMNLVKRIGDFLEVADDELKEDKELVIEAIKSSNGRALEFAGKELQSNKEIIELALKYSVKSDK